MTATPVRVTIIKDPQGGRNMIRHGDAVRITSNGITAGHTARFLYAEADDQGTILAVTVYGGPGFHPGLSARHQTGHVAIRTVYPARVRRMSQATLAKKAGRRPT